MEGREEEEDEIDEDCLSDEDAAPLSMVDIDDCMRALEDAERSRNLDQEALWCLQVPVFKNIHHAHTHSCIFTSTHHFIV